jgi:hypothetical protein
MRLRTFALLALSTLISPFAFSQETPAEPAKPAEQKEEPKPGQPKPYKDVITKDAVTQQGMFKVHRIDDRVLFEIPTSALGKEMLWQTEVAELPQGYGFIGTPAEPASSAGPGGATRSICATWITRCGPRWKAPPGWAWKPAPSTRSSWPSKWKPRAIRRTRSSR